MKQRPRVIIESPLKGDVKRNVHYARCLMFDSLLRGEAPHLGHLQNPQVLDDMLPEDREIGIDAHLAYIIGSEMMIVGMDLGAPTSGMRTAIDLAEGNKVPVVPRWLGVDWESKYVLRPTAGFF